MFAVCAAIVLLPALGQALNGFSYPSNRWSFAFALLAAYILTDVWPRLQTLRQKDGLLLAGALGVYFMLCMLLAYSRTAGTFAALCLSCLFLFALLFLDAHDSKKKRKKQAAALLFVVAGVCNTSFWRNAAGGNYAAESVETRDVIKNLQKNETKAVQRAAAKDGLGHISQTDSFYRYSGQELTQNAGMIAGISSTQYYWSLSNPYVSQFRSSLQLRESLAYNYMGYDDRAALNTLAGVRYFVHPKKSTAPVPYGFTKENEDAHTAVYRNENPLPLGYTYESVVSSQTWNALTAVEKQEALLQGAVLSDYNGTLKETPLQLTSQTLTPTVTCNSKHVSLRDHAFIVTKKGASVTLRAQGLADSETYFQINGLSFQGASNYQLYFGSNSKDPNDVYSRKGWEDLPYAKKESIRTKDRFWIEPDTVEMALHASSGTKKTLTYHTPDFNWYNGRHDFSVQLGYAKKAVTSVTITFSHRGTYSFDSMQIVCQPMESYAGQVAARKQDVLAKVKLGTNTVSGEISLDKPKLLVLSIPYSKGWRAFIDGVPTKLYQANTMYMALDLDAGSHTVKLTYCTPLLREGGWISVICILLFAVLHFLSKSGDWVSKK